jgi:outer membrane protein assembly factor BamE (lipoprotein component of BamABCDE complex)
MLPSSSASNSLGYFTVGSTKDDVLVVQGTPTRVGDYEWAYGLSTVDFRNDRVVSWTIYGSYPLHAKMLPSSSASNSLGYFTVGSTKDDVLVVQGTPTRVGDYEWAYGLSTVDFRNDRVVSWTIYGSYPLHAKMLPSSSASNSLGYFTVGSTKDDVLVVQGTPTRVGDYEWAYGLSTVEFRDGRVVSWTMYRSYPLKARKFQ